MTEAEQLEYEIMQKSAKLAELRRATPAEPVGAYTFEGQGETVALADLFGGSDHLLMIHNMGQGCRYCTLWGDGFNGLLSHLEDAMAVVMVSKDSPDVQRRFANNRGWRFRMLSHGGGAYMTEQCVMGEHTNMPGAAVYGRRDGQIVRLGRTAFGPGDLYNPLWHLLSLGGRDHGDWVPQFGYWKRPDQLDDGGEGLND